MDKHSTQRPLGLRGTLLPVLMALSLCVTATAQAEPPARISTRIATPLEAPSPPAGRASGDGVLIMVCRRGIERGQEMQFQETQPDSPMVCLATQVSEEAAQLGPVRFRELLDKAASAGAMFVLVVRSE